MNSDDEIREAAAATFQFERELESLVLSAFADGAAIEGEWDVELPVSTAPDWTVEIRKRVTEPDDGGRVESAD